MGIYIDATDMNSAAEKKKLNLKHRVILAIVGAFFKKEKKKVQKTSTLLISACFDF